MKWQSKKNEDSNKEGGYDYESAYSAAENITLDAKSARESRAASLEEELERRETPRETRERLRAEKEKKRAGKRWIIFAAVVLVVGLAAVAVVLLIRAREQAEVPEEGVPVLEIESQAATVDELYTYGTHLNISGTLPAAAVQGEGVTTDLVLYNGDFISVPLILDGNSFTLSEEYNNGLYLETIERDTYKMFIRVTGEVPFESEESSAEMETADDTVAEEETSDANDSSSSLALQKKKPEETTTAEEISEETTENVNKEYYYKYYPLKNGTDYQETVYYTMSSVGNRIVIGDEDEYQTMQMTVQENSDEGIYDVVIDPAHGGSDPGASGNGHNEKEYLLKLALKIKDKLEAGGMKVALTRSDDSETLDIYGDDGRVARACRTQAKYMFSLHMNDSGTGQGGLEINASSDLDYTFATLMGDSIKQATGIGDSVNVGSVGNNIYVKQFTQSDIEELKAENTAAGLKPYEPTERSSYYYIIRECGGIVTGAFKDDRNPNEKYNPYCYDNTGIETYILQLGYITYQSDLDIMTNKMDEYAAAIADSLLGL